MSSRVKIAIIALVVGFTVGYFLRPAAEVVTVTEIDTLRVEKPVPYEVTRTEFRTLQLPVMLFAPADTVWRERTVVDSVDVEVAMERRMYQDSTYRAQVSGPTIGELRPSLDWIEVYNRNTTTTIAKKPSRWGFGVQAGYGISREGLSPYIGVGVQYNIITF